MTATTPGQVTADPVLDTDVAVTRGAFRLSAHIELAAGEVLAVLGPNGAGKSTLLDTIAARPGAPGERPAGLLRQDPVLFSHLTARENVAFGPRSQGVPRRRARAEADDWLTRVGLDGFGERMPSQLSGGQQQRVAIARALAARPRLLLLDEPFAALDAVAVPAIRRMLADQLAATDTAAIVVSHDILDALVLAGRTMVLGHGAVVDAGPTAEVFGAPRTAFTAALAGSNLLEGRAVGGRIVLPGGLALSAATASGGADSVTVSLPYHALEVSARPVSTEPDRVCWPGVVTALTPSVGGVLAHVAVGQAAVDVVGETPADLFAAAPFGEGDAVTVSFDPRRARLRPGGAGAARM